MVRIFVFIEFMCYIDYILSLQITFKYVSFSKNSGCYHKNDRCLQMNRKEK